MKIRPRPVSRWLMFALAVLLAKTGISKTYTVLNTNDAGLGSLRQAIINTNNREGPDEIRFNIPSSDPGFDGSVWWIRPQTALPSLTDGWTVIDGSYQASNQGDTNPEGPEIVLSGEAAGVSSSGIRIESAGNTVKGLIISGFRDVGIAILLPQAAGNTILGNYIGTDPAGGEAAGNKDGIMISLGAKRNMIGGPKAAERNILSGNQNSGVYIVGADSNQVAGNYIGINASGDDTLSNKYGILILTGANQNTIGGGRSGDRNLISGNRNTGVFIGDADSNRVIGNFIGTDETGKTAIPGQKNGITIQSSSDNTIGGLQALESNLVSGNEQSGIRILSPESMGNQLTGNKIGTDVIGAFPLPNGSDGIMIYDGASQNRIGPSNTVQFNGGSGVSVQDAGTSFNRITQNSISMNAGSGIVLGGGANGNISPPDISMQSTGVAGNTVPNGIVEIFSDPQDEGRSYEGTAVSDLEGDFNWAGDPSGPFVTVTVTDPSGNTSEFSAAVSQNPGLWVIHTRDSGEGSLRWAIEQANQHQGPDSILFNIPVTDLGFDGSVWWIRPSVLLPAFVDDGIELRGESQTRTVGNRNPYGPEIGLNGNGILNFAVGIDIRSSGNVVSGMILSGFGRDAVRISGDQVENNRIIMNYIGTDAAGADTLQNGRGVLIESARGNWIGGSGPLQGNLISGNQSGAVRIVADSNSVMGNRIGTDRNGTEKLGNGFGIQIHNGSGNRIGGGLQGEGNLISGNETGGIVISGRNARCNTIQGNIIGTDIQGESALGDQQEGIWIGEGAGSNLIGGEMPGEGNLISGHEGYGITLTASGTDSNRVIGNLIGTDAGGDAGVPNLYGGVNLSNGTKNNQIGPSNTIRFNLHGILVYSDSTLFNRITKNSISGNEATGINLIQGGNGGILAPVFSLDAAGIHGTAVPNGRIEIFSDVSSQGLVYEGFADADEGSVFSWTGTPGGPFITATVTDPDGNTSIFSPPILLTGLETEDTKPIPDAFCLFNNFPNPFNPSTVIRYALPHGTDVELTVYNMRGRRMAVLVHGYQEGGIHLIRFDGSALAGGLYFCRLKAGDFVGMKKMVLIR